MAGPSFPAAVAFVLAQEGGYANHPADPGGATKFGITQATLAAARGRPVSVEDVKALTRVEAAAIYRRAYWDAMRADDLPAGLDLAVFDLAVNSGPPRAARLLQAVLGVPVDGIIGPVTLAAARAANPADAIRTLIRARLGFLARLGLWPVFGRGWRRRVLATEAAALTLAGSSSPSNQEEPSMPDSKSILASRTVWANIVGLAAVALGLFGFDTSSLDTGAFADAAVQLVVAASFVASTVFRVLATRQLLS
jgi:lysozyme family protein